MKRDSSLAGALALIVAVAGIMFFVFGRGDDSQETIGPAPSEMPVGAHPEPTEPRRGPVGVSTRPTTDTPGVLPTFRPEARPKSGAIETAQIRGVVSDASEKPIEAAFVTLCEDVSDSALHFLMGPVVATVQTDSKGRFLLDEIPTGGRQVLRVDHEEYASAFVPALKVEPGQVRELAIKLESGLEIRGSVTNDQGVRIAGALIRAYDQATRSNDPEQDFERTTVAGDDGEFTVRNLVAGVKRLVASSPGYSSAAMSALQLNPNKAMPPVEFRLKAGGRITGIVRDADSGPLAEVRIVAHPMNQSGPAAEPKVVEGVVFMQVAEQPVVMSAADGTFTIDGLTPGPYRLFCHKAGYPVAGTQRAAATGDDGVEVVMFRNAVMRGSVVDAETGLPVQRFDIVASREENLVFMPPNMTQSFVNDTGTFEFAAPDNRGDYWLFAMAKGHAGGRSIRITIGDATVVDVGVIRIGKGARVKGRIVDGVGKGVSGAKVEVIPQFQGAADLGPFGPIVSRGRRGAGRATQSDAAGVWQLDFMLEGHYKLRVVHPDFAEYESEQATSVGATGEFSFADLSLTKGAIVRGMTLGKDHKPSPNTKFQLVPKGGFGSTGYTVSSDATGKYEIRNVKPGIYWIQVNERNGEAENPFLAVLSQQRTEILVGDGEERTIDIE